MVLLSLFRELFWFALLGNLNAVELEISTTV